MKKGQVLINVNDIIGKRLGKLEVISYAGCKYMNTLGGEKLRHYYTVKCDCGTVKIVRRSTVNYKNKFCSCGCERRGKRGY